MFVGHWVDHAIDSPGNWFHGWTIPIFPRIIAENQEALSFGTFRQVLSELNKDFIVNGDIEKHKAQELYYHFLIQYFPDDQQIVVLKRRFPHPNVRYIGTNLLVNEEGSLIWPPTSELRRQQVKSEEIDQGLPMMNPAPVIYEGESMGQDAAPQNPLRRVGSGRNLRTVQRRGGDSEHSELSVTTRSSMIDSESTGDIGSLATDISPSNYLEQLRKMGEQRKEKKLGVSTQVKEIFDFGGDMTVDSPAAAEAHITQDRHFRSKRKSSTDDDTPLWPDAYDNSRQSKRVKSESENTQIHDDPIDEEMVGMFSRLRSRTDMKAPLRKEVGHPLNAANLHLISEGSNGNPFLTLKEKRKERVPDWLAQQGKRDDQVPIWLSLVEALNTARDGLHGDDLELFERLIIKPRTSTEVQELITKWKNGELGTFTRLRAEAARPFDLSSWKDKVESLQNASRKDGVSLKKVQHIV
ncbi:hypothetical protein N431DRAFT_460775 [Stipitochalara longipes BDJ]|nr:hypothetical protein N431DRAFT_460775 [Stipitochalara longipes BDJ]